MDLWLIYKYANKPDKLLARKYDKLQAHQLYMVPRAYTSNLDTVLFLTIFSSFVKNCVLPLIFLGVFSNKFLFLK